MNTSRLVVIGAAVAVVLGGNALAANAGPTDVSSPAEALPLLGSEQGPGDTIAVSAVGEENLAYLGSGGIVAESTRYLGSAGDADFWAAVDGDGEVCLVALRPASGVTGAFCAAPAVFAERGLVGGEVLDQTGHTVGVLTSEPVGEIAGGSGWTRVGENLVVSTGPRLALDIVPFIDRGGALVLNSAPDAPRAQ